MCKLSVDIIRTPSGFCALRAECFAHATRTRRLRQRGNDRVVFQRKIYSKNFIEFAGIFGPVSASETTMTDKICDFILTSQKSQGSITTLTFAETIKVARIGAKGI
jgi:hypothetical protein